MISGPSRKDKGERSVIQLISLRHRVQLKSACAKEIVYRESSER